MTEYVQGDDATLTAQFYEYAGGPAADVTGLQITITPVLGGAAVIGPTPTGITHPATGLYGYSWAIANDQAPAVYAVVWDGLDGGGQPVQASEVVTVVAASVVGAWYTDLATLKDHLRLKAAEYDQWESLLTGAIAAASRGIDNLTGRRFWADPTAVARTFNPTRRVVRENDGSEKLLIDDISSLTDLVVETGSASTSWSALTAYETGPDNALVQNQPITELLRYGCWRTGARSRVRITARWGWPAVPDEVAQATLIQAGRLYKRRDSPEGILGSPEWGTVRVSRIDPDVRAQTEHLIIPGIG